MKAWRTIILAAAVCLGSAIASGGTVDAGWNAASDVPVTANLAGPLLNLLPPVYDGEGDGGAGGFLLTPRTFGRLAPAPLAWHDSVL